MEIKTIKGMRIEILFFPVKGQSTSVILFELKKETSLGYEEQLTEEAYYQMFEKNMLIVCLNLQVKKK